jgi:hypothetical protein
MHTKDKLAAALREVGLTEMADRAANAWYDDYLSPLDAPINALAGDLAVAASKSERRADILALRQRVINGDFDATEEEGEAWAASPEGQETFRMLIGDKKP